MATSVAEVCDILRRFISGESGRDIAEAIEVGLNDLFPEDERFEDLTLALASYQPGGGEFLFDFTRIRSLCVAALTHLEQLAPGT